MTEQNRFLAQLLHLLDEGHAIDTTVLDVHEQTSITDYMIICSAKSSRQVRALAENIMQAMKHFGLPALSQHGLDEGEWALIDFGDFVVHIMQPATRDFYNLEGLWQPHTAA